MGAYFTTDSIDVGDVVEMTTGEDLKVATIVDGAFVAEGQDDANYPWPVHEIKRKLASGKSAPLTFRARVIRLVKRFAEKLGVDIGGK